MAPLLPSLSVFQKGVQAVTAVPRKGCKRMKPSGFFIRKKRSWNSSETGHFDGGTALIVADVLRVLTVRSYRKKNATIRKQAIYSAAGAA